ncbi:alpha-fetoprotein enhancer-binding protein [Legionella yabuuchiae]|uniref:alpha-fetoprotein enhancer-binding protein n=1 Tax=Legionella yabuuchiae TaxID=376727 RepID=UPI0010541BB2|nr:alpha-fetoprotein enhancer-binding protein [Legionella yabuuchiae]
MKKLAILLAAGVMGLALTACGGEEKPKQPEVGNEAVAQPKAAEEQARPAAEPAKPAEQTGQQDEAQKPAE